MFALNRPVGLKLGSLHVQVCKSELCVFTLTWGRA
jgi:hypothetical protein